MSAVTRCLVRLPNEPPRTLHDEELSRIDVLRATPGALVWLDLRDPGPEQLELLRQEFGMHPLVEEDLRKRHQRAKLDSYADHQVAVVYEALPRADRARAQVLGEIHFLVGEGWLVSVHWADSPAVEEARHRLEARPDAAAATAGALLYTLLDSVVDGYFPALDVLSDRIDALEDRIVSGQQGRETLRTVLAVKRELLELRRVLAPMRDVANAFLRRDNRTVDDASLPYYTDLYDHLVRILDQVDLLRDLVAAALDANLSVTSNNLNAVMKRLTAVTVILILPTIVSGIYGMNFDHMPELGWPLGYPLALGLMAAVMVGAFLYFRAHDWF
ncbi:MAG TPA: magnesium/cobalt transporter CorA [Candidatus Limnocylindria bacterium]|nr:magnesium/cobalt transporter CorA [Candidatus Limnocylindria bacterium]